jgi:hypothetical protein
MSAMGVSDYLNDVGLDNSFGAEARAPWLA